MTAVRVAAVTVAAVALLTTACTNGGAAKPLVVRITDPSVAKSAVQSKFITDLYGAPHAAFWRTHSQGLLVDIAGIGCVTPPNAKGDVAADFPGLSPAAVDEFVRIANADICPAMRRNGGRMP